MKKICIFLLQTFLIFSLFSQSGTVKGKILTDDGADAEYATVIIMSTSDSTMIKAGYSAAEGKFEIFPLSSGNYFVKVSFVGFEDYSSQVFTLTENEQFTLPDVHLHTNSQELEEVVVKGKKPLVEVKPDRTVFNVEGSINAIGNDGLELLRKSPGVVVDNNENIILQGKSGVQIYLNDKPSYLSGADLANYLKSLQSTDIEAIEIITNPSSKYEAEGNGGIINIRLKKNKNFGTNATISTGYAVGVFSKYNGSINLNNRNEKSSLFGQYSAYTGMNHNFQNFYREQNGWQLDQKNLEIGDRTNHSYRAGADFYLGKQSTIGVMSNGYFSNSTQGSNIRTQISTLENQQLQQILKATNNSEGERQNLNFNLNYRWNNKNGSSFNVDVDYGYFNTDNISVQPNTYFGADEITILDQKDFYSMTPTQIDIYTAKVDYERPLLKGSLSLGAKISSVDTDNTYDFFNIVDAELERDNDRSNSFTYIENVSAGYVNYQRKIEKWAFQVGLRGEHTHSDGDLIAFNANGDDRVIRNYFDLFPSGGITYDLNQKNSFRISYSKRLDRPKYQDLNPFEFKLDELTFGRGNAFLNPQYTDNIQLTHTFNYSLNTTLSYSKTKDLMARITDKDASNELAGFITQLNVAEQEVVSLTVSYPFTVTKWWNIFTNVNAYHMENKSDYGNDKTLDLSANVLSLYSQNTFTLPKDFTFELSGFYNSPTIWEGSFQSKAMWAIEAGLQKKLLDGRANLKLSVSDIFQTQKWNGVSTFGGFYIEANGGWESRRLKLNFSYLLGNNQVKTGKNRKSGLEEESARIKG